jgi:hypothetical protein
MEILHACQEFQPVAYLQDQTVLEELSRLVEFAGLQHLIYWDVIAEQQADQPLLYYCSEHHP